MNDRRSRAYAAWVTAFACAALVGCTPDAAPSPTPEPTFATEDEAFAAAEAVYREYIAASNAGGDTLQYLTGSLYEEELAGQRSLKERNLHTEGTTKVMTFEGTHFDQDDASTKVTAQSCIDISDSRLRDEAGADVTPAQRDDTWVMNLTFIGTPGELFVTAAKAVSSGASC